MHGYIIFVQYFITLNLFGSAFGEDPKLINIDKGNLLEQPKTYKALRITDRFVPYYKDENLELKRFEISTWSDNKNQEKKADNNNVLLNAIDGILTTRQKPMIYRAARVNKENEPMYTNDGKPIALRVVLLPWTKYMEDIYKHNLNLLPSSILLDFDSSSVKPSENDEKIFQLNTEMDDDTFLSILKKSNEIKPVPDVYDSINSIPQSNETLENVIENIAGGVFKPNYNDAVQQYEQISSYCVVNTLVWLLFDIYQSDMKATEKSTYKHLLASTILFSYDLIQPNGLLYDFLQLFNVIKNSKIGPNVNMGDIEFEIKNIIYKIEKLKLAQFLKNSRLEIMSFYFESNNKNLRQVVKPFVMIYHNHFLSLFAKYIPDNNVTIFIEVMENMIPWKLTTKDSLAFYGLKSIGLHDIKDLYNIQLLVNNVPENDETEIKEKIKKSIIVNWKLYLKATVSALKFLGQVPTQIITFRERGILLVYLSNLYETYNQVLKYASNMIIELDELKTDIRVFLTSIMDEEKKLYFSVYELLHKDEKPEDDIVLDKHKGINEWITTVFGEASPDTAISSTTPEDLEFRYKFNENPTTIRTTCLSERNVDLFNYNKTERTMFMKTFQTVYSWIKSTAYPHYQMESLSKKYHIIDDVQTDQYIKLKEIITENVLSSIVNIIE